VGWEHTSISQHYKARQIQSNKGPVTSTSSTSALFFCPDEMACPLHVIYRSHPRLALITDRTSNWDPLRAWVRRHPKAGGSTAHSYYLARLWCASLRMQQARAPKSYPLSCFTCSIAVVASRFGEWWMCPAGVALECRDTREGRNNQ
jgi:hypothetical protein